MIWPTAQDLERAVVYRRQDGSGAEDGVITSFNHVFVFVRYKGDLHSKATDPNELEWLVSREGDVKTRNT